MPANNPDTEAKLEITVQSKTFLIPHRYVAGELTLSEGEAHALQQVYAENLRNNFASQMKKAAEDTENPRELTQEDFDKYIAEYEFGVRTGGGIARNPVESEERRLAMAAIKTGLAAKGQSWKALSEEQQEALLTRVVATGNFRAEAEKVVEAKRAAKAAAESLTGLDLAV